MIVPPTCVADDPFIIRKRAHLKPKLDWIERQISCMPSTNHGQVIYIVWIRSGSVFPNSKLRIFHPAPDHFDFMRYGLRRLLNQFSIFLLIGFRSWLKLPIWEHQLESERQKQFVLACTSGNGVGDDAARLSREEMSLRKRVSSTMDRGAIQMNKYLAHSRLALISDDLSHFS